MNKAKSSVRIVSILILALVLLAIPLLGTACGSDEEKGPIEASFEASAMLGTAPLEVEFTDQSTGDIDSWQWDFDNDGVVDSEEKEPTYTFNDKTVYVVTLTVAGMAEGVEVSDTATLAINATGVEFQKKNLVLNNPHLESDPSGNASKKFKELIELYTNGDVSVTIHHNGSLYDMSATFEALKTGAIQMASFNPGILQGINPNLAAVSALRGLVANAKHGREVIADPAIKAKMVDYFEEYNVRFLDYIEAYLLVGFFSPSTDLKDYTDFDGKTYWWGQPGKAAPIEEMFNPNTVYYAMEDIFTHLMNKDIDILTFPPDMAYAYGIYNYFDYCLLTMTYSPNAVLMNSDTWDNMVPELQDLINDVIMPQVQAYVQAMVVTAQKEGLKVINEALDAVRFISPEREQEVWGLVQTRDDFIALKDTIDPDILTLIENLRPATPTMDQDVIDILNYANIPIPE